MTTASSSPISLTDLAVGAVARLHDTGQDPAAWHQLRSLGLTTSSEFRLCKKGEPWIVQVRSTRIGISSAVARRILVVPVPAGAG